MSMPPKKERLHEPTFPNLEAERKFDREEHIRRAMANGMSRAQAEQHADEDMREHAEGA